MSENPLPSWPPGVHELRLGPVSVDLRYRRVISSAGTVELPQRPFELLCLFLAEPDVLHTRAELFARVWKGVIVEDANLSQSVWLVRNAIGEAKPWLRTVAKSGYVFEPPVALVAISDAPQGAAMAAEPEPAVEPDVPSRRRLRGAWLFAFLCAIIAAGTVAWLLTQETRVVETGPIRVVLVDLDRREDAPAIRPHWSLALLHAWVEWRLSSEPDAVVVEAPRLGQVSESSEVRVVLLSAEADPADQTRLRLAAHLTVDGATRSFGGSGALADVAPRIDALSRETVAALVEHPVALDTPPLDLNLDAAKRYTDALALKTARRPADAAAAFEDVIAMAPAFGLAYAQQATVLGDLGRMRAARARFAQAAPWIARLPAAAAQIALAQERMAERDFRAAQAAYADLSARYPAQPVYVIEHARALFNNRDIDAVLEVMSAIDWERQPPALLAASLILRANAQLQNSDSAHARQDALRADEIAERNGWPRQRGQALLVVAQVAVGSGNEDVGARFEDAAREFEQAGDLHGALSARISGEVHRRDSDGTRLRVLLEEAHAAGDTNLEVFGLRAEALRRVNLGELGAARDLLTRATRIVQEAGDMKFATSLPYELLQAIYLHAEYAAFDSELAQIDVANLRGAWRANIGEMAAGVAFRRGRFADADAAVQRFAPPLDSQAGDVAGVDVTYGCILAEIALRRGDLRAAQTEAARCAANGPGLGAVARDLVLLRVASLGGDSANAVRGLDKADAVLRALHDDIARWGLEILAAQLRLQAGDVAGAGAGLVELRRRLAGIEMPTLRADLLLTSAECALAQDLPAEASRWLDEAKALLPADDWIGSARVRILDAVLALRRGSAGAHDTLRTLVSQARERGDQMLAIAAMSLIAPADAETAELRTRTGLRNLSLRWLLGSAQEPVAH